MAGSLNHLVSVDGSFQFDLIENLGDAHEACEECFRVIARLCDGDIDKLVGVCHAVRAMPPPVAPRIE